jgi:hypothetical protein
LFRTGQERRPFEDILNEVDYAEDNYMIVGGVADNENAKGVIQLQERPSTTTSDFPIIGITIRAHAEVITRLKQHVKGFFFVRQKRIPLTLC